MAEQPISAEFNKGYIFAKLEDKFTNANIEIDVQGQKLIVYNWPEDLQEAEIKCYLESFTFYAVMFDRSYLATENIEVKQSIGVEQNISSNEPIDEGNIIPELSPFFPTMLAQPHILGYSVGYRSYDKVFKTSCLPVSIGDQFSLYQVRSVKYGHLYLGIEACVWAVFEARSKSLSLINADYYVALPLTYINNKFSARLRLFHESSHLGDEFILENKNIQRVNPSMEVADLSLAYDFTQQLTGFIGYARVLRSDESFKIKPNNIYYGFNYFFNFLKINICNIEAVPYAAAYFTNRENNKWALDSSAALGYQWDKLYGHKLRIYLEAHDGYSDEGQFSKQKTRYLALKLLYGY